MSQQSPAKDFLITGVSSGLGRALLMELLDLNFSVIGICRQIPKDLASNQNFHFIPLDLNCPTAIETFLTEFPDSQIPKHLILNAAFNQNDFKNGELNQNCFNKVFQINLLSNIAFLTHFSNRMQDREGSSIVTINDMNYIRQFQNKGLGVGASKSALESIMRNYRLNPFYKKINFLSVFPSKMEYDSRWPLADSYHKTAKPILSGIFKRKETLYLPKWKFLLYEISRILPDKLLRGILHLNFSNRMKFKVESPLL